MVQPVVFITGKNPLVGKGGGSSYVRAHARAALQAGFEPHIFCADFQAGVVPSDFGVVHCVASPVRPYGRLRVVPEAEAERFFAHWLHALVFSPYMVAAHAPFIAVAVEQFLGGRAGPHLMHGFYTWGCVGLTVSRRLGRRGIKTVVVNSVYTTAEHEVQAKVRGAMSRTQRLLTQAELLWIKRGVNSYERRVYAQARLVLVNYDAVHRLFEKKYGARAEVRKLPYASEAAFLHAAEPADRLTIWPDAPLIVAVSRHDARKGIDVLLRALARLRAAGVRFRACLIGGGPLLAAHRRLANQLGIAEVTVIKGIVPDPQPYLQQADIFVLPSLQEGSGSLSLLEALQAGAAIVASNIDGIAEDVTDGDSALLVEPDHVAALSQALRRVLTDHVLRAQLQRRARATFAEKFSATALTEALRQTYAELGFESNSTI